MVTIDEDEVEAPLAERFEEVGRTCVDDRRLVMVDVLARDLRFFRVRVERDEGRFRRGSRNNAPALSLRRSDFEENGICPVVTARQMIEGGGLIFLDRAAVANRAQPQQ